MFRLHSLDDLVEASGEFGLLQPLLNIQSSLGNLPFLIEILMPFCEYKLLVLFKASVPPA
jgi:hypothetical protein